MGWNRLLCAAWAATFFSGCASVPPPRELDLRQMRLVAVATPPQIDVSRLPGGKAVGAGVGAGTGSGAGVLASGALCVAAGPLFPLCVAALLPTAAVVGAVTGGVIGAVKTESIAAIELKTKVLRDELAATPYQELLAQRLQLGLHADRAIDASADAAPWTLDVAVTEVGTEGKSEFALRLVTRIALRRGDSASPVWTLTREVQSETELTMAGWTAADSRALHIVLDRCIDQAAHELLTELTRPIDTQGAAAHPRSRYSSSCKDVPSQVTASDAP